MRQSHRSSQTGIHDPHRIEYHRTYSVHPKLRNVTLTRGSYSHEEMPLLQHDGRMLCAMLHAHKSQLLHRTLPHHGCRHIWSSRCPQRPRLGKCEQNGVLRRCVVQPRLSVAIDATGRLTRDSSLVWLEQILLKAPKPLMLFCILSY